MAQTQHCPGFENHKQLGSLICKCANCQKEIEIFSDELNKEHKCKSCGQVINPVECTVL